MDINKLKSMELENLQEELQKGLDDVKANVEGMNDLEDLEKYELKIDKEQAELDDYIKGVTYELQESTTFEGVKYSRNEITRKIIYYLNKVEQDFQYCLGLHELVKFWKNTNESTISHGAYDSTLRILGGLKYKGDSEWTDILAINNYLSSAHNEYIKDRSIVVAWAEKRNTVLSRMQLVTKDPTNPSNAE